MQGKRRDDGCINCGEVRAIAAHGLCFRCYRREERATARQFAGVDRHNPGIRREHKQIFRGFTSVMVGLSDLGVSKSDVLVIRAVIEPYLAPIAKFLVAGAGEGEGLVNGEQHSSERSPFTVRLPTAEETDTK